MDWQLKELCLAIYNIPELEGGFHFIGLSQGGLHARGYMQLCNCFPVRNLITWVSPQAGVYRFNEVYFDWKKVYTPGYQGLYSFVGYWKDPYQYETYLANSSFLPYLNNESPNLEAYAECGFDFQRNRHRILSLEIGFGRVMMTLLVLRGQEVSNFMILFARHGILQDAKNELQANHYKYKYKFF
jgi:hypothetical protein